MPDLLVESKLLLPRTRTKTVARPRLDDLLARGGDAALTLIAAPAGFGKTTLLGTWLGNRAEDHATAWVALDARDRDATTFWTYVLTAVDRAAPGTAAAALDRLGSGQAPVEAALTALLNELSVLPGDLTVVLDDYHLAEGPDIEPGMAFLVDHLPPQVHVVISSRTDPGLPLARLRARGDLVEIRAADLRFTGVEARAYLNDVNALDLGAADVEALERRTEGWVAALQLAALSLQDRDDPSRFIAGFTGDDRFVVDYLADEVLDRQPDDLRRFLLDTAVLERLSGPLCDAVTATTGGAAMLELLERQNLFVVPLDDNRRWYRYHHLFADVLRAHLLDERPADAPVLHRRASKWYERAGEPEAAVRHALASGDVELAADQVECALHELARARREDVTRRWLDELPADIVRNRPVLAVGFIGALMASNEFDDVERRLEDLERLLTAPTEVQVVVDRAELARVPGEIQMFRAALALVSGDLSGAVEHADLALSLATAVDDDLTIASVSAIRGLSLWAGGDLEAAHDAYRAATDGLEREGRVGDVLGCSITLADLETTLGRLGEAERTFGHALDLAARSTPPPRGVADMQVGLSRLAWERGDADRAADCLRVVDELGESAGLPQNPYRWRLALASLRAADGDTASAIDLIDEAERAYVADFAPEVRPIAATRARVLVDAGDLAGARAWVARSGVSENDDATYLREYEHATLVHVLLAEHAASGDVDTVAGALALTERLLTAAESGGRLGSVIELLALRSLALDAIGEREAALGVLDRAVSLAEPEGYARSVTGSGQRIVDLLGALAERRADDSFVRRLLATAIAARQATAEPSAELLPAIDAGTVDQRVLVDPLSNRELDVLRYLGSDLDGPAIAREMSVSLATVRTHTQHIYTKLGVNSRRTAVRRAHQLDLFPRSTPR